MSTTGYNIPRMPRSGEKIRADWGAGLVRSTGLFRPVQVPGMLISRGTHGTSYVPMASNSPEPLTLGSRRPFDVRWYVHDEASGSGEWQVYIPLGCLTVEQAGVKYLYVPVNDRARDADGREIVDWYRIPAPEQSEHATIAKERNRIVTCWAVYLNMKPWPRVQITTNPDDFTPVQWTETIAELRETEYRDKAKTERSWTRLADFEKIEKAWDVSKPFSIRYDIEPGDIQNRDVKPKVVLTNTQLFVGRLQKTVADEKNVTGWGNVWVKIIHDGEKFKASVERDLSGADADSNDDQTVYRIFALSENIVIQDLREEVPEMDFYTSVASAAKADD